MIGKVIRPTMRMADDILCRMHEYESWIFEDCAIIRHKDGRFSALLILRMDDGYIYYGFIHNLHPRAGLRTTREKMDAAWDNFEALPKDVFTETIDWSHVEEGNRYYP